MPFGFTPVEFVLIALACLVGAWDLALRLRYVRPIMHGDREGKAGRAAVSTTGENGFWPTPWLGGILAGHLQTIVFGLGRFFAPSLPDYTVEKIERPDGGTIELVWPDAGQLQPPFLADVPVVLILTGLHGTIRSSSFAIAAAFAHRLRPVVLHRRGDGLTLTSPNFNLFGDTDDVRAAVATIRLHYPDPTTTPLLMCSTSVGTGLAVRMMGEDGETSPFTAAFCNCPGYDIGNAGPRACALYIKYFVRVLKREILYRNRDILEAFDKVAFERCARATTFHEFLVGASAYAAASGGKTFAAYLEKSNPMHTAALVTVPTLILNAEDDPICTIANVDDNMDLFQKNSNVVLLRASAGGHCSFLSGLRARHWGFKVGMEFFVACLSQENGLSATDLESSRNLPGQPCGKI